MLFPTAKDEHLTQPASSNTPSSPLQFPRRRLPNHPLQQHLRYNHHYRSPPSEDLDAAWSGVADISVFALSDAHLRNLI